MVSVPIVVVVSVPEPWSKLWTRKDIVVSALFSVACRSMLAAYSCTSTRMPI
jgi:hypothetical protein